MLAYQEKQRLSFERTDELTRLFDVRPPSADDRIVRNLKYRDLMATLRSLGFDYGHL